MNKILDIIYPRHCPLCGKVLVYQQGNACKECLQELKRVKPPVCFRCGKHIDEEETEYCQDCMTIPKRYIRGYPVFEYSGKLKQAIYEYKYKNQRIHTDFFVDCIYHCYKNEFSTLGIDGIIPIPIHKKRKKIRGYNQAELLAKQLGNRLHIPVYPNAVIRVIHTNPQKELGDKARVKNLKNAFKLGSNTIKLNKVLLVDDIYTTGATIDACTKILMDAGVKEVYYTSIAIGKGY